MTTYFPRFLVTSSPEEVFLRTLFGYMFFGICSLTTLFWYKFFTSLYVLVEKVYVVIPVILMALVSVMGQGLMHLTAKITIDAPLWFEIGKTNSDLRALTHDRKADFGN